MHSYNDEEACYEELAVVGWVDVGYMIPDGIFINLRGKDEWCEDINKIAEIKQIDESKRDKYASIDYSIEFTDESPNIFYFIKIGPIHMKHEF